ncbi:conserved hypothetical protein [Alteracholeplasma palmae J233]|uniref:HD-GYP domain-containing protein n=1 Tax=Alteracholeplasma palmae (strain ATCC 49389 / J233) TaxID=1318466 RepID=U4KRC3_ALTPJ|nr:HD domain-containing protein [Alteracholeplasma palmae]CCV64036.1 conserved hypothetical protein [Alteracholeplasma palmae J233]
MKHDKIPKSKKVKTLGRNLFAKFFGFDQGIDIAQDVAVLHRRNIVIKNIIFMSNILYSLIFFAVSLNSQNQSDWLVTVLFFPLTYAINKLLKTLIAQDKNDKTKQQVAMYVASFYMFLSSILVYIKVYPQDSHLETPAYTLIYYALVVISLYQDKKLLSSSFLSMLTILTMIHFVLTYNIIEMKLSIQQFFEAFITRPEFSDIVLRTVLFIVFYLVVYVIVSIGQQLQEERKKELVKRRQVQDDFSHIVSNLFSVVFSSSYTLLDAKHANQVLAIANKLAEYYNLPEEEKQDLNLYALVHLQYDEIRQVMNQEETLDEINYQKIKEKTELGAKIARRLQLAQKTEDIVRAHLEGSANETFKQNMLKIQPDIHAQIILLSDIYVTLRNVKPYKRPYSHAASMEIFTKELVEYFDYKLQERFLKYDTEIKELYNSF